MSLKNYLYNPIEATAATIRLLRISRGKGSFIVGELKHFSLDSRECPTYTALSYVWGTNNHYPKEIILNGHRFLVLQSLYPALEVICDTPNLSSDWWWIDSICINQGDDKEAKTERSSQVHLMERIYRHAKRTVGWLGEMSPEGEAKEDGEVTENGEDAIDFLYVLLKNRRRLESQEQKAVQELSDRAKWANLEKFLRRRWWKRVWTLQEYIISPEFIFYCGKKWMRRHDFKVATLLVNQCREVDETLIKWEAFNPAWNRRRLYNLYREGTRMPLVGLIAYVSDCGSTDPRDRIYSLLGLATDKELGDPPNYNSDVNKVYLEFAKSFVETYKSLDIICFAHLFNQYAVEPALQSALPSWVPDWRAEVLPFVVPVMASQSARTYIGNFRPIREIELSGDATVYESAGSGPALEIAFSDDFRLLICKGILVDCVDGIGGLKVGRSDWFGSKVSEEGHRCINSTSSINSPAAFGGNGGTLHRDEINPGESSKIIEDTSRCLVLNRKDRYLTYPTPPNYFLKDFQSLCLTAIARPTDVHHQFFDWFQLNKFLYIRGHSLEELCKSTENLDLSHLRLTDSMGEMSFTSRFNDTTKGMTRRLITTNEGYLGMAPYRVRKGDKICVLLGCNIPLVLRQRKDESSYEVIGECYLHGFMNGEALQELDSGKFEIEDFQLS
jgi:Heterokaryon incompatibility protein (HET)